MGDTAYKHYNEARYSLSEDELHKAFPTDPKPDLHYHGVVTEDWGSVVEASTGEDTGLTRRIRGRDLRDILHQLYNHLESEGLVVDEYFDVSSDAQYGDGRDGDPITEWPENVAHIMVYAVEGGSEGHYVHVDVRIMGDGFKSSQVRGLFLLKTFMGLRHAQRLANALTEAFYQ